MSADAATNQSAMRALAAGDMAGAHAILLKVLERDRRHIGAWLNLAAVCRQLNDLDGALNALREVLLIDPRNFPALLMHASLLEHAGRMRAAAAAYAIALVQAPPDQQLDPPTLQAVGRARSITARHTRELDTFIRARAGDASSQCTSVERRRLEAFIGTTLRTRPRYQQEPLEYYYPGLPPIEFHERGEFAWLPDLEAATEAIRDELGRIVREDPAGFTPYIHYDEHQPLDQWRELNHSPRWSAFHFYADGKRIEDRCQRAPATMRALARLPQPQVARRSPSAMFSCLRPRTRIPPHTGIANFRLVVHLPLIVPGGCRFRVGGETRDWRVGEAWVFDDTIEHEAWNDSDETRIILICDVWNPRLSEEERTAIDRVIAATDVFNETDPSSQI